MTPLMRRTTFLVIHRRKYAWSQAEVDGAVVGQKGNVKLRRETINNPDKVSLGGVAAQSQKSRIAAEGTSGADKRRFPSRLLRKNYAHRRSHEALLAVIADPAVVVLHLHAKATFEFQAHSMLRCLQMPGWSSSTSGLMLQSSCRGKRDILSTDTKRSHYDFRGNGKVQLANHEALAVSDIYWEDLVHSIKPGA